MKIAFYDLETTGFANACGIHQIALLLVEPGVEIREYAWDVYPGEVRFDREALSLANKTIDEIRSHRDINEVKALIDELLLSSIREDEKWTLCGYNNHRFDNRFWKMMYDRYDESFKYSVIPVSNLYFHEKLYYDESIDVSKIVRQYFKDRDDKPENFSLSTVARFMDIAVEDSKLHTANYDTYLTHQLYLKLTNLK